jgi:lipoprotein-releasing system permease protein
MNLSYFIAKRYLFSKKSTQAINIISFISVIGVCIGSAALFIILSVFNGFEELNLIYYQKLSPDLKISSTTESYFHPSALNKISNIIDSSKYTVVNTVEDQALLKYGSTPYYAIVKGVSEKFLSLKGIDSSLIAGKFMFSDSITEYAVIGKGISDALGIDVSTALEHVDIYAPKSSLNTQILDPSTAINQKYFFPSGIFSVQQNLDERYIFCSLGFSQELFGRNDSINGVEIYCNTEAEMLALQEQLEKELPIGYLVKNRYELNEVLYKVLNTERWAVYLILTLILTVAICNIIGAVTMLIIDKKKDIALLSAMGMNQFEIRKIYFIQSILISVIGLSLGLTIGGIFVYLQDTYGLVSIGGSEQFLIQKYPVKMIYSDYFLVFATVMVLSIITGWLTSAQSKTAGRSLKESIT